MNFSRMPTDVTPSLQRFLRVRKYDEDRAFETLKYYHIRRAQSREIFDLIDDPKSMELFIRSGAVTPLREGRAKDGTFVILAKMGHGFQDSGDFLKFSALIALTMEKLLENEEAQDAMPIRLKAFKVVNESGVLDLLYSILTMAMSEKMKKRLAMYGTEFKKLYDTVDPKYLPFSLGGSGPDVNGDWWAQQLITTVGAGEDTAL